jgi:hypothetical protein
LSATARIVPLATVGEQTGGGFPAFTTTPLLPLLETKIKQELPHPASAKATSIAARPMAFRRLRSNHLMD